MNNEKFKAFNNEFLSLLELHWPEITPPFINEIDEYFVLSMPLWLAVNHYAIENGGKAVKINKD